MQVSDTLINRIVNIEWLSHCGEPYQPTLSIPVRQVISWKEATKICKARRSENATLEARNDVHVYLQKHHIEQSRKWNELTRSAKATMAERLFEPLERARSRHNLDDCFMSSTRWNVLAAMMEDAYTEFLPDGPRFFDDLLTIYEAGHYPCGWVDADWPKGVLAIY